MSEPNVPDVQGLCIQCGRVHPLAVGAPPVLCSCGATLKALLERDGQVAIYGLFPPGVPDCPAGCALCGQEAIYGCELPHGQHPGPHEPERCPPWCKLPHGHPGTHEPL